MGDMESVIDFSERQRINDSIHWHSQVNQTYHPTGVFQQDGFNIVYSSDNLNTTKFIPILLKEWFFLVKKNGYLVIDYQPNVICDWRVLEKHMNWLWEKGYEIISHGVMGNELSPNFSEKDLVSFIQTQETLRSLNVNKDTLLPPALPTEVTSSKRGQYLRFVCKKLISTIIEGDRIDKWTFGIITNGKRLDWLEKIIDSISAQTIPHYEVIVCGTSPVSVFRSPKMSYLPFNRRDDLGWITYKKNMIMDNARYENVCVIHDRIIFSEGWYEGMKKWGNCFEHMSCKIIFDGQRDASDWPCVDSVIKKNGKNLLFTSALDYRDWHRDAFVGGSMHIGKKSLFVKYPWPLSVYWNEGEDFLVSNRFLENGYIPRLNIHSEVATLSARFSVLPKIKYSPLCFWKKLDRFFLRRYLIRIVSVLFRLGNETISRDF